ncbi:MAG: hypothetical protein WDO68_16540 [Gammaproteobacteria bacterium]
MSSSAITNGEYSHDYRDWMFVRNEQILSNYPKGSGIPIILYSCFAGDSSSTAASLSRDAGAVVYGAQDFAWTRQLRPGVVEAFSAAKDARGNPGARSSFVAVGSGSHPFGNAITSIVFDKNTGKATVNYKEVETGSRIPVNKEATVCMDEKCKK